MVVTMTQRVQFADFYASECDDDRHRRRVDRKRRRNAELLDRHGGERRADPRAMLKVIESRATADGRSSRPKSWEMNAVDAGALNALATPRPSANPITTH
jgi:hypothetical protein